MGMFQVSIPVAYGEGENAFYRLQVEIIQRSDDRGIFDWDGSPSPVNSMLAVGPHCFPSIDPNVGGHYLFPLDGDRSFMLTNSGLRIRALLYQSTDDQVRDALIALDDPDVWDKHIAIIAQTSISGEFLAVVLETPDMVQYERVKLIGLRFHYNQVPRGEIRSVTIM